MSDLLKVRVGGRDYLCKWDGIKTIYSTDFSSFDVVNKIDYPKVGQQTSYNNTNKTYFISSGDGSLVVDSNSNNTVATNGIQFDIVKDTSISANVKINYWNTSGSLHFLWFTGFGFDYETSYGSQINIMVNNSLSYGLYNGATFIENDAGYNWIKIPNSNPSIYNVFSVNFHINGNAIDAELLLNGTVFAVVHGVSSSQKFFIDPRKLGTISCKNVEIRQHQL